MRWSFRYIFLLICATGQHQVWSQDFLTHRVDPMVEASKEYYESVHDNLNKGQWDCPPNLDRNESQHFSFLDSLPLNPQFEEELLTLYMGNNCEVYYSLLIEYISLKPFYDSILLSKNVPSKYSIIPLVTSGCNPTLKYQGDKSGEWQLSYINARKYGLHVNAYEDERNSHQLSTIAAAKYLNFLDSYYLNNELLVITAFYTSVPFVNKQLNKLDTVNSKNFYNILSPELQGHFSYLKSWVNWIEHFEQPSVTLSAGKESWGNISVNDTLSFETISKFMDISITDLKNHNPVFIGQKVIPNAHTSFQLPQENAQSFQTKYPEFVAFQKAEEIRKAEELEKLRKQMESGIPDLKTHKAITYTVKSGDVLGKIAGRYNVKVSQIKQWNHLKSDRINIGQKLIIYVPKSSDMQKTEEKPANKIETKPQKAEPGNGTPQVYTVKNGESLWLIAKKFPGVSAQDIMRWNGCTDKISPGMKLKIYEPDN